jgi:hypothetical protein
MRLAAALHPNDRTELMLPFDGGDDRSRLGPDLPLDALDRNAVFC